MFVSSMLTQLVLASAMVVYTITVHLFGLALIIRVLRSHHRLVRPIRGRPLTILLAASIGLFAIHTFEIWSFAAVYMILGAFRQFEPSLYFSTVTYATIGYGDIVMPHAWRIMGAIEGATGVIMLGWSTAFLVSLLAQLKLVRHDWLTPDEADSESDR